MEIHGPPKAVIEAVAKPKLQWRQLLVNGGLLAASLLVVAALSEIALRAFYRDAFKELEDERTLTYRYDARIGWFPIPNSAKRFTGFRTINIKHNSNGFRDHEPVRSDRPGIVFLGDSLVWGFD